MSGTDIQIDGDDGSFSAYISKPESGSGPGLVVIQEIFGVNAVMRDICDEYAAQGFIAICPDLFWRLEPNIQITDQSQAEWDKAFDLFGRFDVDAGMTDVAATLKAVRGESGCNGKAGSVGYCLGGLLAYLSMTRTDSDAGVGYYGVSINERLDEAQKIKNPLILHVAEEDGFVPKEAQEKIAGTLMHMKQVTIHTYAGMDHAFARRGGGNYNADAASLANARTSEFLHGHLD